MTASWLGEDAAAATSSVLSINVVLPTGIANGDIGYISHTYNPGTGATTTPTGWTLISTDPFSASMETKLYRKTLVSGDSGATVTLTNSGSQRMSAAVGVLTGVSAEDVVNVRVENVTTPATNAAPTATAGATDVQMVFWNERSSTPSTAIVVPSGVTSPANGQAFGSGTGACSSVVGYNLTPVSSGGTLGGGVWDPDVSNNGVVMYVVGVQVAATVHSGAGDRTATASASGAATVTHAATGSRTATASITGGADVTTGTTPDPEPPVSDFHGRAFRIDVYDENLNRLGRVGEYMQADVVLKHNQIGVWSLLLDIHKPNTLLLPVPGRRVVIHFEPEEQGGEPEFLMSGPVVSWEENDTVGELQTLSVAGYDDKYWLDQRIAYPVPGATFPAEGTAFTQAAYQDSRTGPGEAVAKAYINANLARLPIPNFTVAPSLGRGLTVSYAARMHQLFWMVFISCTYSGLGFDVKQIDGELVFDVYEPQEQPVRLSKRLGNLSSFKYRTTAPKVSHAIGGGTGEGTARKYMQKSLPSSATGWGVREAFLDASDADTDAILLERLNGFLADGAPAAGFTLVPRETRAMRFGRDYRLGDKVRVEGSNGLILADTVRQVDISHTVADGMVITPGIGYTESTEPTAAIYRTYKRFREDFENFKRSI